LLHEFVAVKNLNFSSQCTKLGLARARLDGRVGGNRASLRPKQQAHALAMIDGGKSQSEVGEVFRVHRSMICRLVAERRVMERA
jgi:DNA invertase Pin-like site-specific DNA recombinase